MEKNIKKMQCPYCGRNIPHQAEYDSHVKTCNFGHRPNGYENQKKLVGGF